MSGNPFNAVLTIKASDWPIAVKALPYIRRNLKPKEIIIISAMDLKPLIPAGSDVRFLCEDEVFPGMTLDRVRQCIRNTGGETKRAGWYLKQLINLSYGFLTTDKYYLAWDMDTIPLRPIDMIDSWTGRPIFDMKPEYYAAYFNTIETLLGYRKPFRESFISEHMLFQASICRNLIHDIEKSDVPGSTFYEKIINASDFTMYSHAFAEYETYGTYVTNRYPGLYRRRRLDTFRAGKMMLGENPSEETLAWVGKEFDTVSFESWMTTLEGIPEICASPKTHKIWSFRNLTMDAYRRENRRLQKVYDATREHEYNFRKIKLHEYLNMDWFFCKEPWYKGETEFESLRF